MKKFFTKRLFIYMLGAFFVTIAAIFLLQTVIIQRSNSLSSQDKLLAVKEILAGNEENVKRLTDNLGEDNLAKTRAFADLLAEDPAIARDTGKLNEIKDRLMVNELHIIDEKGIITSSTIDAYVGFDMTSGEQSNAFMVIVDDPSIEIVQEPQVNVAEGVVVQYIGVARTDAKGLVQVGVQPEVLENMLASTEIDKVLGDVDFGETGYVYAIDAGDGTILAHKDASLVGTSAVEAGFPQNYVGSGKAVINGEKGYYQAEEYEGQIIGTFMPAGEYYGERRNQTFVFTVSMIIIFGVLLFMINRLVDRKIVQGINRISDAMKDISNGNFAISVDEQENPEFSQLSDSINKMVGSINKSMTENDELLEHQKRDMDVNRTLIQNIKKVCTDLEQVSGETQANADNIYHGTGEQEEAVQDLKQIMNRLTKELSNSADVSGNVMVETENTVAKIMDTQSQMDLLKESMQKITDMSMAIGTIISEINSIAEQTNLLSLNASIEAARAGEVGKGFAVVATQVGELAARSAQAAKETNELITNSINAVENGKDITDQTVRAFGVVVENMEKASKDVKEITDMVKGNVDIVADAVDRMGRISDVVEKNVQISRDTKQVSSNMADVAGKLLELVEEK